MSSSNIHRQNTKQKKKDYWALRMADAGWAGCKLQSTLYKNNWNRLCLLFGELSFCTGCYFFFSSSFLGFFYSIFAYQCFRMLHAFTGQSIGKCRQKFSKHFWEDCNQGDVVFSLFISTVEWKNETHFLSELNTTNPICLETLNRSQQILDRRTREG